VTAADTAETLLAAATGALPAAEDRPGQREMARRVADAFERGEHLVVQAGTGTGKSLAYLTPAIAAAAAAAAAAGTAADEADEDEDDTARRSRDGRVVVVTATKALQDQLATKDLPLLAETIGVPFTFAVLKGRSNYLCLQRLEEVTGAEQAQLELDGVTSVMRQQVDRLAEWANETVTGDQADLSWSPADATWRAVSVGSDECPGARRCPQGPVCFAEKARARAAGAAITIVNAHLYGLDVASDGMILPDHAMVVFDEAHVIEDVMSDTVGVQIRPGRFAAVASIVRRILDDRRVVTGVEELASTLDVRLAPLAGQRLALPLVDSVAETLTDARLRLGDALTGISAIDTQVEDARQRKLRAQQVTTRLIESVDRVLGAGDDDVVFVSGSDQSPRLELAPLDVGPTLRDAVWSRRTAVLTSATIPTTLPHRVGLGDVTVHDVGSPFDYQQHSLLYCAMHLPDPRSDRYRDALHDELAALIIAAGGRTLSLFTSWKGMDLAAEALIERLDVPVLTQRDLPKTALIEQFRNDEATCLFATMGLFQGVDVPGRTLSLVTIDRLPFPRPDDPLLSARREGLGPAAFDEIDLPRAAMLLAQASGRLIRTKEDRGAVAVFDPRLGTARYRWRIVNALPPMRRTRHRSEIEEFLAEITTQ
jgi:ATP-dependent DNA helicase DinG